MKIIKKILYIIVIFLIVACASEIENIWSVWSLRRDVLNDYEKTELKKVMSEELGDDYTDNLKSDFDSYVIDLIMDEVNKYENEDLEIYNSYISQEEMEERDDQGTREAEEINGEPIEEDIYYMELTNFYENEAFDSFKQYIPELKKYKNLVLDLRDNSGGNFSSLESIADVFLGEDQLVYRKKTKEGETTKEYSTKSEKRFSFDNIVILTNEKTASSSELLILALQHHLEGVTIVGRPTLGKHVIYSIRYFRDGTGYRLITGIMEGPGGRSMKGGISPDIDIDDEEEQLNEAVECIGRMQHKN